jgi:hypothetical protein
MQPADNRPVLSLILGIVSIVFGMASCTVGGCCVAWLPCCLGIGGWYVGAQVQRDLRDGIAEGADPSMANAGVVTSIIGTVLSALVLLLYGALFLLYGGVFTLAMLAQLLGVQ